MFSQASNVMVSGGTLTQVEHHVHRSTITQSLSAFERLQNAVAPGAFHNSGERFDPPKCHPRTRLAVIERIMNWILGKESTNSLIMWLNGAAGAGKSAIAQTIAELCYEAGILLASFFFSRSDSYRNQAKFLFPTLAYQIACAIPDARSQLEMIVERDPLIFTRSLEAQMIALIVEPLQPLVTSGYFEDPASSPRLVIIDGLDEVLETRAQSKILEVISDILRRHRMPLIFLVASRPEQQISFSFSSEYISQYTTRLRLDDTFHPDEDIRLFLDDSLTKIKAAHPRKRLIPPSWPSTDIVDTLVRKASGQFIYASTVANFVASMRHRPTDRLDIVLGLRPVQRDLPFAELDALYMHILSTLEEPDRTLLIIGTVLVGGYDPGDFLSITGIERLLGLELGDVEFLLIDMTSLVSWEGEYPQTIHMLHASFGDFLFDPFRSGKYTIDEKAIHTTLVCHCFQSLNLRVNSLHGGDWWMRMHQYALTNLPWHLSNSNPVPELINHLKRLSLEDLFEDLNIYLPSSQEYISDPYLFWNNFFHNFISSVKYLGLEDSEYRMIQTRNYDQIIKKELDIYYQRQPSIFFLLCLRFVEGLHSKMWTFGALSQLTDLNTVEYSNQVDRLGRIDLIHAYIPLKGRGTLREFLHDAPRSGKYAICAETYANVSLSCLRYLSRHRLGTPINSYHTRRNLAQRRNSPWRWRLRLKHSRNSREFAAQQIEEWFPKLHKRLRSRKIYSDASSIALKFLPVVLNLSAESSELIDFASSHKAFSQRALQFPGRVKKCRLAIAAYLERTADGHEADADEGG